MGQRFGPQTGDSCIRISMVFWFCHVRVGSPRLGGGNEGLGKFRPASDFPTFPLISNIIYITSLGVKVESKRSSSSLSN